MMLDRRWKDVVMTASRGLNLVEPVRRPGATGVR